MHIPQFFCMHYLSVHIPLYYIKAKQQKKKEEIHLFYAFLSRIYEIFTFLSFTNILFIRLVIFLSSKLRIRTDPQPIQTLVSINARFCSIKSSCAGDGRTDKIQSASEPLTAFTIPWILSASVNSPSSRWITASPTTRIP